LKDKTRKGANGCPADHGGYDSESGNGADSKTDPNATRSAVNGKERGKHSN
jgi:hypothetical protein